MYIVTCIYLVSSLSYINDEGKRDRSLNKICACHIYKDIFSVLAINVEGQCKITLLAIREFSRKVRILDYIVRNECI